MNRVTRGTVVLAAVLVAMSCAEDPTGDLRNGADHLIATPSAVFLNSGASIGVLIEVADDQGNLLESGFTLDNFDAGITVVEDAAYNNVYNNKGELVKPSKWTRARYIVTADANTGDVTFTVSASGKSLTIPVRILPTDTTVATLSNATGVLGDTVKITAPAPFKFTPASVVTAGAAAIVPTAFAADSSSISFLPGPSANSVVSVSSTVLAYAPSAASYSLVSTTVLTTPPVTSFTATFSNATPGPSEVVTITASPPFKFRPTATLAHGSATGPSPVIISRAADSSAISFIAFPGGPAGPLYADGVVLSFLTAVPINDLPSTSSMTPQAPYAGTGSFATAPVVTMPTAGNTTTFVDATPFNNTADCNGVNPGGFHCRIYTFTIGTAVTLAFSNTWNNTTDLGLYFDDVGHTDPFTHACDGKGNGAAGQPETCSVTFAPGTYFMQMTTYHPFYPAPDNVAPTWYRINVTGS